MTPVGAQLKNDLCFSRTDVLGLAWPVPCMLHTNGSLPLDIKFRQIDDNTAFKNATPALLFIVLA